jgi:hypothetical protein
MNTDLPDDLHQRLMAVAVRVANLETVSAAEQLLLRTHLDRILPLRPAQTGFPERRAGDTGENNTLRRTNWFNGRYLTAGALSQQDVYFHHRSLLNAQALMPGIAWGLGIERDRTTRITQGEGKALKPSMERFILRRGLAFDGIGQPILVSQDYKFTLAELIGVSPKTPRQVVVGGQREFMPCVCLAPDPRGASGGSPALSDGPYLLVIEAGEEALDRAKASRDLCGGRLTAQCEADAWQGSFGLSLVRFPVDVTLPTTIPLGYEWRLRGMLSAYYFDVFEHPLWSRWDYPFPVDGSFSRDSGPGRHGGTAIPLAMVYLENDSLVFIDSWIPRRVICATPGEDWHRTRFGAPPRAAAWARLHQFQAMLQESLKDQPMPGDRNYGRVPRLAIATGVGQETPAAQAVPVDLYSRGFLHIPPIGFLPLEPRMLKAEDRIVRESSQVCIDFSVIQGGVWPPDFDVNGASFSLGYQANTRLANHPQGPVGLVLVEGHTCIITLPSLADSISLKVYPGSAGSDGSMIDISLYRNPVGQADQELRYILQAGDSKPIDYHGRDDESYKYIKIAVLGEVLVESFCYTPRVSRPQGNTLTFTRSSLVGEALRQGKAYFESTNVFVYGVAALHDDDILEDLHNVIDKDPIQLDDARSELTGAELGVTDGRTTGGLGMAEGQFEFARVETPVRVVENQAELPEYPRSSLRVKKPGSGGILVLSNGRLRVSDFLSRLGTFLHREGLEIEGLVNRHTEVVKLIVPLQSLSRRHPLLGDFSKDAVTQSKAWGGQGELSPASLAGLLKQRGIHLFPRPFVVYVKQRLILLDLAFEAVEIMEVLVRTGSLPEGVKDITVAEFVIRLAGLQEEERERVRYVIGRPVVQSILVPIVAAEIPDLARGNRPLLFLDEVQKASVALSSTIPDPGERMQRAIEQVLDGWATEIPDMQVLQLLAAVQSPEKTTDLVRRLGALPSPHHGPTVREGLNLTPPSSFKTESSRRLYANVFRALEERLLRDVIRELPADGLAASLTVGDLLSRSPQDAEQLVGGAHNVEVVRDAFRLDREQALTAAKGVADGVPQELLTRVQTIVDSGVEPSEAIERVKQEENAKSQRNEQLLAKIGHTATLLRLGGNRLEVLRGLRRQPGG